VAFIHRTGPLLSLHSKHRAFERCNGWRPARRRDLVATGADFLTDGPGSFGCVRRNAKKDRSLADALMIDAPDAGLGK